jgi:branched-chain amino acid transport system permease protein
MARVRSLTQRFGLGRMERKTAWTIAVGIAVSFFLLFVLPDSVSRADRDTLFTLFTVAALAQAWNIVGGFGGQFSLGNAAFVGIGAYTCGVLFVHTGLPMGLVLIASGLVAALFAAIAAIGLLRLRGVYFAIGSLAVALAAYSWAVNWNYIGATQGLSLPIQKLPDEGTLFRLTILALIATTAVAWALTKTPFGLRLQAVRDDEEAATVAGVNAARTKMIAFALSAFLTGVVGALFVMRQIFIDPSTAFSLSWTIDMIVMTIVGGIGTVAGPLLGAFVVYYGIEKQLESSPEVSAILTGVLLVAVVRFAPGGLWGLVLDASRSALGRLPLPRGRSAA